MEKLKGFKAWILELFKDERKVASVKPVIAIMGAIFLNVTMLITAFSHKTIEPSMILVDAVMFITVAGMGADTVDKFSRRGRKSTTPTTPNNSEQLPNE